MSEVITRYVDVLFDGTYKKLVEGVYQYDHGLKLRVRGVPTDVEWQMQWGYRGAADSVTTIASVVDDAVVGDIPDALLMQQREAICYLYYEDTNYGITVYEVYLPLIPRLKPATGTYTPEQIEAYDQLVAELQELISNVESLNPVEKTTIAPLYENLTFPVSAGQHCWYSDTLYKAKQDIISSETWTAAHWDTAVIGAEIVDLKNVISKDSQNYFAENNHAMTWESGYLRSDGTVGSDSHRCVSSRIYPDGNLLHLSIDDAFQLEKIVEYSGTTAGTMTAVYTSINVSGEYVFQNVVPGRNYRLQVYKLDGTTLSPSDISDTDVQAYTYAPDKTLTASGKVADAKATGDAIDDVKSAMMKASASGAPAHFTDGAAMPIQKINVSIMPTQSGSGDPSGSNIRPLSGYTAIRLHHYAKNYNSDLTSSMALSSETGQTQSTLTEYKCHTGYIPATKKVYINAVQGSTGYRAVKVVAYDSQKQFISTPYSEVFAATATVSLEVTLPENTAYIRYSLGLGSGTLYYVYTDYERAITAVDVPATPGTIYAGELILNGDGSGVFRARPYYASYNGETLSGPWISDRDVYAAGASPTTGAQVVDLGGAVTEYPLTADETREIITLYGENYIAANGDTTYTNGLSVTAEYYATPELYVDQHLEAYAGMIGPDEGGTATENHAVGALIRSGHTLYRATASIATGEEFVPGTNVTETTVNAEIARIWAAITA